MRKLQGVIPPMITPFDQAGNLDIPNLEKLLHFLKAHVEGVYICGSYGSGPMMNVDERKQVAETAVKILDGAIRIVVHTGTTNTRDTVALSQHAEAIGCDAVSAVGPYYFHHHEDAVLAFYAAMRDAVSPDFPVYVYHNPKFSGYAISLQTMKRLKALGVNGVKDATFDILTFATYMRELATEEFDVVLGTEAMWLAARSLGAEAYIPGLGNAFPELCQQMWQEGMANDFDQCRKTQFEINQIRDIMYLARSTQLAVYAMLDIRGILTAYPRAPFVPATDDEKRKITHSLQALGLV
jgi:dihydrodipicolinate synthase/N-acetylneuraminate lyase